MIPNEDGFVVSGNLTDGKVKDNSEVVGLTSTEVTGVSTDVGGVTSFFISAKKQILDVRRGVLHPYHEPYDSSYSLNYDAFLNGIGLLFSKVELFKLAEP